MKPGVMIEVGECGQCIYVPALTVKQLRKHRETLTAVIAGNFIQADDNLFEDFAAVAHEVMVANHPGMTQEQFFELLDLRAITQILLALLGNGKYVMPELPGKGPFSVLEHADPETLSAVFNGRSADA